MRDRNVNDLPAAIVVGATSGIGHEVACLLATQGYRVGAVGRRGALLDTWRQTVGAECRIAVADVTADDLCSRLDRLVDELGGRVDRVIYCSGTGFLNDRLDPTLEQQTNRVNVEGFTVVADWSCRLFERQGGGHFAAISSVMGLRGSGIAPAYAASKAYQINYMEGLRQRAAKQRLPIWYTDVRPGSVRTAMMKGEGHFWIASPRRAAEVICRALDRRKRVQYVTPRWRWVACILRLIPRPLYEKM